MGLRLVVAGRRISEQSACSGLTLVCRRDRLPALDPILGARPKLRDMIQHGTTHRDRPAGAWGRVSGPEDVTASGKSGEEPWTVRGEAGSRLGRQRPVSQGAVEGQALVPPGFIDLRPARKDWGPIRDPGSLDVRARRVTVPGISRSAGRPPARRVGAPVPACSTTRRKILFETKKVLNVLSESAKIFQTSSQLCCSGMSGLLRIRRPKNPPRECDSARLCCF